MYKILPHLKDDKTQKPIINSYKYQTLDPKPKVRNRMLKNCSGKRWMC